VKLAVKRQVKRSFIFHRILYGGVKMLTGARKLVFGKTIVILVNNQLVFLSYPSNASIPLARAKEPPPIVASVAER